MRINDTGVRPGIVFTDASDIAPYDQNFFYQNMPMAYLNAIAILHFGSEEAIIAGEFVRWEQPPPVLHWEIPIAEDAQQWRQIDEFVGYLHIHHWDGSVELRPVTRSELSHVMERIIQTQLNEFRAARSRLNTTPGLLFFVSSGDAAHYNTSADIGYFTSQPAYLIMRAGEISVSNFFDFWPSLPMQGAIMLAFTADVMGVDIDSQLAARDAYIRDFVIIAVALALVLALVIVLLFGAGRKYGHEGVHFAPIDKPYLDFSLAALAAWTGFIVFIVLEIERFGGNIGGHNINNIAALTILFSGAAVLVAVPLLLWIMSLVKRIKAGRFWRHTLIFALPRWICVHSARIGKSLWAGFPVMLKIGLISGVLCGVLLIVGSIGAGTGSIVVVFILSFLSTAVITALMLHYVKRIQTFTQSALNEAVDARVKSERLKTELITNVSHDIRTPLTSIITYTDLLKHEGLDCEQAPAYLDILIQKSQRLKTLTDELFEASKAASGNVEANITELCLVSLINQVLGELDSAIESSGLILRVNLPERLMVLADGRLMWRVMENLLSNVFKYALPGSRVYLDAAQDESLVCVELKNISATELNVDPSELTERFKRGDDSRADGSSGLGLSIVQSFITAQGGKFAISIDGDLFKATVYLPPATSEEVSVPATPPESNPAPADDTARPHGFLEKLRALKDVFRR
jgi:signal transduction histidine kinase